MTSNVGTMDRAIRFVLGIILIALGLTHVLTGGMAMAAYFVGGYRAAYRGDSLTVRRGPCLASTLAR